MVGSYLRLQFVPSNTMTQASSKPYACSGCLQSCESSIYCTSATSNVMKFMLDFSTAGTKNVWLSSGLSLLNARDTRIDGSNIGSRRIWISSWLSQMHFLLYRMVQWKIFFQLVVTPFCSMWWVGHLNSLLSTALIMISSIILREFFPSPTWTAIKINYEISNRETQSNAVRTGITTLSICTAFL